MHNAILQLETPFFLLVSGPSNSGKSYFCRRLIQHANELFDPPVENYIWCYSEYQDWYEGVSHKIRFHKGMIDIDTVPPRTFLIIDDMTDEPIDSAIATKISHHRIISVAYLTQNLFHKGKSHRDLSLNSSYICLTKNPRDKQQASILGRQLFPGTGDFFTKAFQDATCAPYGYLFICLTQTTPEELRLVSHIFPGEKLAVYIPKKS